MDINSKEYWDNRFETCSWEYMYGKEQTAYFAEILINNIVPRVLYETTSCLDWGCALGQLCEKWCNYTGTKDVVGYDFSEIACLKGKELYPHIEFVSVVPKRKFDTLICSNMLEHVENWKDYLNRFTNMAEKYIVILVPYECDVFDEHVVSFKKDVLPKEVNNFIKIQDKIIQCNEPKYWMQKQQLVVYKAC